MYDVILVLYLWRETECRSLWLYYERKSGFILDPFTAFNSVLVWSLVATEFQSCSSDAPAFTLRCRACVYLEFLDGIDMYVFSSLVGKFYVNSYACIFVWLRCAW